MATQDVDTPGASRHRLQAVTRVMDRIGAGWLLVGVLALMVLYHWLQALRRVTPWIFPDELRYTEFARAAGEGTFNVSGETRRVGALQGYLLAPAWFVDDAGTAWSIAKLINVVAFCLTAIPVYLLTRRFVSSRVAVLAALASSLLPISFYSGTMMQEAIALPIAATTALLTVQILERFSWARVALLALVCVAGAGVRAQMTILPLAAAGAFLLDAAANAIRRRPVALRTALTGVGFVGIGVIAFREGYGLDLLQSGWSTAVNRPGDTLDTILHSVGVAVVGVAVIPAVALLATLNLLGSEDRSRAAFAATAAAFGTIFIAYTGLKSASLNFIPVALVEERNLIYLEPLAIVAVAAVATMVRWPRLVLPTAATIALLVVLPITAVGSSVVLSENPSLSWVWHITGKINPDLEGPLTLGLVVLAIVGALALGRRRFVPPVLVATSVLGFLAGAVAYHGDQQFSRGLSGEWLQPNREWVDKATGGKQTALLISGNISDPNGIFSLVFWNKSIGPQLVVPGAAGLGIAGAPVFPDANGTYSVGPVEYALHTQNVSPDGDQLPQQAGTRYLLTRMNTPTRLRTAVEGVEPDRWVRDSLLVRRFAKGPAGDLSVEVTTMNPLSGKPRVVTATVGSKSTTWTITAETTRTLLVSVPAGPFSVTFALSPSEIASPYDPRRLSLQVNAVTFPG